MLGIAGRWYVTSNDGIFSLPSNIIEPLKLCCARDPIDFERRSDTISLFKPTECNCSSCEIAFPNEK